MNDVMREQMPYLRRFARALLGAQAPADSLVAEAVRNALASPDAVAEETAAIKLLLYRSVVECYKATRSSVGHTCSDIPAPPTKPVSDARIVASRIQSLPRDAAIVLLLTALEGLDTDEIASVMGSDRDAVEAQLRAARTVLNAQPVTTVLIIEDEPVIAMDIAEVVRLAGHQVLGIATTEAEAVELAGTNAPGLILADIRLADDSSGIDAVARIRERYRVPVIFITAYPELLLDDPKLEPSLLITKPFNDNLLRVAIAQVLDIPHAGDPASQQPAGEKF